MSYDRDETEKRVDIGGAFTLLDDQNNVITERNLLDQYTLVMFGFTRCPSICPDQLTMLSSVIEQMRPLVSVFFVTLDPEYDTIEKLQVFHKLFNPSIKMLTGPLEAINKMSRGYKVYSNINKENPEQTSHSSIIYLMGKDGKYLSHFVTKDPNHLTREIKMVIY